MEINKTTGNAITESWGELSTHERLLLVHKLLLDVILAVQGDEELMEYLSENTYPIVIGFIRPRDKEDFRPDSIGVLLGKNAPDLNLAMTARLVAENPELEGVLQARIAHSKRGGDLKPDTDAKAELLN